MAFKISIKLGKFCNLATYIKTIQNIHTFWPNICICGNFSKDIAFPSAAGVRYHKLGISEHNRNALFQFGGQKSEIKVWAELVRSENWEGESAPCLSPSVWWFAGNLWHSLACEGIILNSAFTFTWCSTCVHVCLCPDFPLLPVWLDLDPPNDLILTQSSSKAPFDSFFYRDLITPGCSNRSWP